MPQYHPCYHASDYEEIAEPTPTEEYLTIKEDAETLGLYLVK